MDILKLEQQRLALEATLSELRTSLKHWQTRDGEYEGLKEELQSLSGNVTTESLEQIAKEYGGALVDEKEVRELSNLDAAEPRNARQILDMIQHRQDYVQKNIDTIQKRFFEAEAKAEELAFAAGSSETGEDGDGTFALTEIQEELDDEGNVISSFLSKPEQTTAQVVESLRKAGVSNDVIKQMHAAAKATSEDLKPAITNASPALPSTTSGADRRSVSEPSSSKDEMHIDMPERPSIRKKSVSFSADTKPDPDLNRSESEEKKVSFAEKVAVMPAAPPPDTRTVSFSPQVEEIPPQPLGPPAPTSAPSQVSNGQAKSVPVVADPNRQAELRQSFKPGDRVAQLDENDELESIQVVMPDHESAEDAKLRREMLDYHLNEVGHVVAQIDLDEDNEDGYNKYDDDEDEDDDVSSYLTGSERPDDEESPYTTGVSESEDDDEDQYGRSKRRAISDDYLDQMKAMEQRLIGNLGPKPTDEDLADADPDLTAEDVRRLVIRDKRGSSSSTGSDGEKSRSERKRVSFAPALEVVEPGAGSTPKAAEQQIDENLAPVKDAVSERIPRDAPAPALPPTPMKSKPSRFKQARAAASSAPAPPNPPQDRIVADTLVERVPAKSFRPIAPTEPTADGEASAFDDPIAERRQLATELYRRRNNLISQQGGFRMDADKDENDELGEWMEEGADGRLKKVSRFRAARVKGTGL